jgi:hypothetical protein
MVGFVYLPCCPEIALGYALAMTLMVFVFADMIPIKKMPGY